MGNWSKRIKKAQRLHRPELKDWECDGLYRKFPFYVQELYQQPIQESLKKKKNKRYYFVHPCQAQHPQSQFLCFELEQQNHQQFHVVDGHNRSSCYSDDAHRNCHQTDEYDCRYDHASYSHDTSNRNNMFKHNYGSFLERNRSSDGNEKEDEEKKDCMNEGNSICRYYGNGNDYYHAYDNGNQDQHRYSHVDQEKHSNKMNNHVLSNNTIGNNVQNNNNHGIPAILDAKFLTKEEFWYKYEHNNIPCIIKNIPYGYDDGQFVGKPWPAIRKWNLQTLIESTTCSSSKSSGQTNTTKDNNNNHFSTYSDNEKNYSSNLSSDNNNVNKYSNHTTDRWIPKQESTNNKAKDEHDDDISVNICKLGNRKFKCGEDDDKNSIKIRLKYFLKYLQTNRDDSPLYVFDSSFERDTYSRSLLQDYTVPSYFNNDLFTGLVSEYRRPPYRWILIGPQRSGSTVHIDPLGTNAWNTLLQGQKRWCLFPPHVPKHIVKGKGIVVDEADDDEAIHYFMYILPKIRQRAIHCRYQDEYRKFCCYEFTQHPGETVFVPNGWWHAVLNLTHTVGVTQNYVSKRNFHTVWKHVRTERKRMAWKWLQQLQMKYHDLYIDAITMNANDKFIMKYDPNNNHTSTSKKKKKHKKTTTTQKQNDRSDGTSSNDDNEDYQHRHDKHNQKQQQLEAAQEHRKKMQRVV